MSVGAGAYVEYACTIMAFSTLNERLNERMDFEVALCMAGEQIDALWESAFAHPLQTRKCARKRGNAFIGASRRLHVVDLFMTTCCYSFRG